MIRSILTVLFVAVFLVLSLPIQLVLLLVGKFNPWAKKTVSLAIVSWAFNVVQFLSGVKKTVIGEENVPKDKAVLYVGNHRSIFDIVIAYPRVPRPTGFISKKEVLKVPLLNIWMIYMDCLFLDRSDLKKGLEMILSAIDKVKNGISIFIYPEGTRNKTDEPLGEFHKGSFKIAQRTDCPIIPVVINHSDEILEKHVPFIKSTHITLEYCKPVIMSELSKEDQKNIDQYVKKIIEETYLKNQNK
ncbi:lysophospholipid acyltransferase family protein [Butyrivibrio sp. YAB3001]|uniref:lysophospholipid acyltransferase family protein n=1 Tax=Butyrivibrio sp. YAB3001 TaxID=1520812 RepID=UPI0008F63ED7|nr:lysophospholipid acyltransferase family protein [Butyrivibrio sp. YAB3001]SFC09072.1 1-acyl-sn-glycerol-3-phosphate acyltransferase [Butyrivibrio sp. YAB3001]